MMEQSERFYYFTQIGRVDREHNQSKRPITVEYRKTHSEGESNHRSIAPIECSHADTTQTTATKFQLFRMLRTYVRRGSRGRRCQMLPCVCVCGEVTTVCDCMVDEDWCES